MKLSLIVLAASLALCGLAACHRSQGTGPAKYTGCRISQIIEASNDSSSSTRQRYTFSYNDDGTVANITLADLQNGIAEWNKKFIWGKNFVKIGTTNTGSTHLSELDSFVLNDQKKVTDMYMNANQGLQDQQVFHYSYDAAGEMNFYTETSGGEQYSYTYQYQDGDIIKYTISWGSTHSEEYDYEYDTTLYNTGNMNISINDLENYGMPITSRRRLRRKMYDNSSHSLSFSYSLDADGKIIGTTGTNNTSSSISTTQITYACE